MDKQFVPHKQSLKLKELGFEEECLGYYNKKHELRIAGQIHVGLDGEEMSNGVLNSKYCSAPLWQQAFDWFREKHNLHIFITPFDINDMLHYQFAVLNFYIDRNHLTYQEAQLACLDKLIEIVEQQKKQK